MRGELRDILAIVMLGAFLITLAITSRSCVIETNKMKADCFKNAPIPYLCRDILNG